MTTNLRTGLAAVAVAMLTAVPASAAHAAPLQPSTQIDNMGGFIPAVAVNAGSAIVGLPTNDAVKVATSAGAGQWNPTVTLSSPTAKPNGVAVTVDEDGTQTAVWGEYFMIQAGMGMPNPGPTTIHTATRTATGAWSAREELSPAGNSNIGRVSAVAAPDGRVTAVWGEASGFKYATRTPGGAWTVRGTLAGVAGYTALDLAVAQDGTIAAAWIDPTANHAMVGTLAVDGTWTAVDVSGADAASIAVEMDATGDATAAWKDTNGVWASRRTTAGGAWSAPAQLSGANGAYGYYAPGLAVDARGRATAAWNEYGPGGNKMYGAYRAEDGTWSAPVIIGPGESDRPAVARTPDGESYVSWYGLPTRLVTLAADGTWSGVSTIGPFVNSVPVIATDADGDAVIAGAPNGSPVQVAGFDNAGPGLQALTVPAAAAKGATFSVSVAPLDLWTGLGTVTWDFGDGTTATGSTATHRYLSAGAKTVKVTATDALGRARTRTRTVTVGAGGGSEPTPEPPAPPAPTPPPAAPSCTPRGLVKVKWTLPKRAKVRRATLTVSGVKPARALKRTDRSATVDLRQATGTVTVTIRTRTTKGKLVTRTLRYTLCS